MSNALKAEENRAFVGSKIDGLQLALDNLPNVQQVDENQAILTSKMDGVQSKVDRVQWALSNLPSAQQVGENKAMIAAKIDGVQSTLCDMVENAQEVYSPVVSAPAPSHTVDWTLGMRLLLKGY